MAQKGDSIPVTEKVKSISLAQFRESAQNWKDAPRVEAQAVAAVSGADAWRPRSRWGRGLKSARQFEFDFSLILFEARTMMAQSRAGY